MLRALSRVGFHTNLYESSSGQWSTTFYNEILTEDLFNGLGFCRRLDDQQILGHNVDSVLFTGMISKYISIEIHRISMDIDGQDRFYPRAIIRQCVIFQKIRVPVPFETRWLHSCQMYLYRQGKTGCLTQFSRRKRPCKRVYFPRIIEEWIINDLNRLSHHDHVPQDPGKNSRSTCVPPHLCRSSCVPDLS